MSDLILVNANVMTMEPAFPRVRSIRVTNGSIVSVSADDPPGKHESLHATVIDCEGKTVVPGFIDAHCHLASYADSFVTLDLGPRNVTSIADIQTMIREAAQKLPPESWIKGRGYNEFYLAEKRHPTRWDLDAVSPVHPVRITHRSGHVHLLNSLALQLVGISAETGDPPGGLIDRDITTGEPTGLLYGMGEILARVRPPTQGDRAEEGIRLAGQALSALGVTSVHDVSSRNDPDRLDLFYNWKRQGFLPQRVTMTLGWKTFLKHYEGKCMTQESAALRGEDHAPIEGVKIVIHEITGQLSPNQSELNEMVLKIHRSGYQAILHAIEESHVAGACTAIEQALGLFPRADHRHRIEHCSVCPPALAKRIASSGITVVTQPAFVYYNGERYLRTVPERDLAYLYPVATLMRHKVAVAGSSDCPVIPPNPLIGIYSAATRRAENGEYLLPEEKITPLEALSLFTSNAARATCTESAMGSVRPGKFADLVVLSGDPTVLPEEAIKDIQVDMTIINGEIVWERR